MQRIETSYLMQDQTLALPFLFLIIWYKVILISIVSTLEKTILGVGGFLETEIPRTSFSLTMWSLRCSMS